MKGFRSSIFRTISIRPLGLMILLLLLIPPAAVAEESPSSPEGQLSMHQPYRLCAGDRLEVVFSLRTDVYRTFVLVRTDGMISLPLVDDVQAAGLRLDELSASLQEKFSVVYRHPKINVILSHSVAARAFVGGEVDFAGVISLRKPVTVREALTMAGGVRSHGALTRVVVVRKKSPTETEFFEMDLTEMEESLDVAGDFYLQAGDLVLVPMKNVAKVRLWVSQYIYRTLALHLTADFAYILKWLNFDTYQR